jgi:hypothetical protein
MPFIAAYGLRLRYSIAILSRGNGVFAMARADIQTNSARHYSLLLSLLFCGCATLLFGSDVFADENQPAKEAGEAHEWLLPVVDDEETVEKKIAHYIREVHGIEAEYKFAGEDDLFLQYNFNSNEDDFPNIAVFVDSLPSNSEETDDGPITTERRVTISAYYVLPDEAKTPESRAALLELINEWHIGKWVPQRIYLDHDGDIAMESSINVPGKDFEVHTEVIIDQMYRMYSAWASFYHVLQDTDDAEIFVMPAAAKTTAYLAD